MAKAESSTINFAVQVFYSIITMLANAMHVYSSVEILMQQTKVKSTLLILITMITMITLQN